MVCLGAVVPDIYATTRWPRAGHPGLKLQGSSNRGQPVSHTTLLSSVEVPLCTWILCSGARADVGRGFVGPTESMEGLTKGIIGYHAPRSHTTVTPTKWDLGIKNEGPHT